MLRPAAAASALAPFHFPVLVADIGGTNARFALLPDTESHMRVFADIATASYSSIEAAIEDAILPHADVRPHAAIVAGAGPVADEALDLTNANWVIRPRAASERLGLGDFVLLNDFEALALGLTALDDPAMTTVPIGPDIAPRTACRVIVGPGTGLGVAGLIHVEGHWTPVPSEGGHIEIGPAEADEFPIWAHIDKEDGRVSAESLFAGRGIVRLYRAVAAATGETPHFAIPAEVTTAALLGADQTARRTMDLYCRLLGRLAGDLALVFMATGGVFIGGGIMPRIAPILLESEFRAAFEAKAPHEALMRSMTTRLLTAERPALIGLATFARAPDRFGVSLEGRRWRSTG